MALTSIFMPLESNRDAVLIGCGIAFAGSREGDGIPVMGGWSGLKPKINPKDNRDDAA